MNARTTLMFAALLSVSACAAAERHEAPVQGAAQDGGGSSGGSNAFPNPVPAGNLKTTPVR